MIYAFYKKNSEAHQWQQKIIDVRMLFKHSSKEFGYNYTVMIPKE